MSAVVVKPAPKSARVGQRAWQAEPGEDGVLEACHRTDAVARELQHEQPRRVPYAIGCEYVRADGRLTVRPGWHERESPAGTEDAVEEPRCCPRAYVLERDRRH